MIRALVALILGAAVTFGLIAFMAYLVSFDDQRFQKPEKIPLLLINPEKQESKTQTRTRIKPPPPLDAPPRPAAVQPETNDSDLSMSFEFPLVNVGGISAGLGSPSAGMMQDGDATPIIRIEPRYPTAAARHGKEGYVILSFSINEIGGVEDIKVLEAKPKYLFNKEAKRALRRWRYKPKMVDGKPQKQTSQTIRLEFSLEKQGNR